MSYVNGPEGREGGPRPVRVRGEARAGGRGGQAGQGRHPGDPGAERQARPGRGGRPDRPQGSGELFNCKLSILKKISN